ncbi:Histidine kinase [Chryseobacterium taichungense]|uniref:Histidine kinase n=1 Tax=Chryseobacterium taichungense TaxID=295069 RepID=A0A1H8C5S0_9FLAO|nr:histidine kinase [Chryseobacterium taichungense]SEM90322.1 Histidine kinase [Chryseobacterium taichungense]
MSFSKKENGILTFAGLINFIKHKEQYHVSIRILSHVLMWLSFTLLLFFDYYLALNISFGQSMFLSVRVLVSSAVVFYLFFYCFLPYAKKSNNLWMIIIVAPLLILTWLFINNFFYVAADYVGYDLTNLYPIMGKEKGYRPSLTEVFKLKFIILNSLSVIYSLSPFFFTKIIVDVTRLNETKLRIQKQKSDLEINNINIEKEFLKAQLNPHFLFNTLNNLYALTVKKDDKAPEIVLNLSDIMAYTLYESNTEKVSLQKELEFISNYFALEKMRYPEDKKITLTIKEENPGKDYQVAPLLTFVFIENAFKYGLKSTKEQFVNVIIDIRDDTFFFVIENDTENAEKADRSNNYLGGIGLSNAKKRLTLLYPDMHELSVKYENGVYMVSLKISLNEQSITLYSDR